MLSTNKPIMQQKLNNLLNENGPVYNAAYNAILSTIPEPENNVEMESDDTGDMTSLLEESILKQKNKRIEDAKKFAKEFVDGLKFGGFMDAIADEIDSHIKSTQLLITMQPQGVATLISPVGPCTGTMIISDTTANIQLL